MKEQFDILQELLELTDKQRSALKTRDLATFQSLTEEITVVYNKFTGLETDVHNIFTEYKKVSGLPSDVTLLSVVEKLPQQDKKEFQELAKDLVSQGEELKLRNDGNLAIINNSLQTVKEVIKIINPQNHNVYGGAGKVKENNMVPTVLDKTV